MTRPLRSHDPETIYHVISRGNDRQPIFLSTEDFEFFLQILTRARIKMGCRFFAYCLMTNHFHLLVRAEGASLSRIMHYVLTTYARRFNLKFARCGHVFENRFKAIPCRSERYFLALLRYIHLNPVRAGVVEAVGDWRWSGHQELIDFGENVILDRDFPLSLFSPDPKEARRAYASFLEARADSSLKEPEDYFDRSAENLFPVMAPESPKIPSIDQIGLTVARETGVSIEQMQGPRRVRSISAARRLLVSRATFLGWSTKALAEFLNCSISGVSRMSASKTQ